MHFRRTASLACTDPLQQYHENRVFQTALPVSSHFQTDPKLIDYYGVKSSITGHVTRPALIRVRRRIKMVAADWRCRFAKLFFFSFPHQTPAFAINGLHCTGRPIWLQFRPTNHAHIITAKPTKHHHLLGHCGFGKNSRKVHHLGF